MTFAELKEVQQTSNTKEVNEWLAQGYKIVKIISSKVPVNEHGDMLILPMYVLGKK